MFPAAQIDNSTLFGGKFYLLVSLRHRIDKKVSLTKKIIVNMPVNDTSSK